MLHRAGNPPAIQRKLGLRASFWAIGFTLLFVSNLSSSRALARSSDAPSSSAAQIVALRGEPLTQYRAYRRMHAKSERFDNEAWLEAWTEYDERGFRYEIVAERGSEYVRNKVLKAVLKREQELIADGEDIRSALTPSNYEFKDIEEADGLRYVIIKPKRKDVLLVDGRVVLTGDGRDVLRVEGRLAKNPSFWTSLVNVIRHYARLDGVRVPVATESMAKLKFAGLSRMDVRYEYETINNRPVSLSARRLVSPLPLR